MSSNLKESNTSPGQAKKGPAIDFRRVRSLMETPILDEKKWSKLPSIPADAFLIDLEDSVVPQNKELARKRAVQYLNNNDFFAGKLVIARPNNISTAWGRDDIIALAEAGVKLMAYPKARSCEEILEVQELLAKYGAHPHLFPIIETAGAVLDIKEIAKLDAVAGLFTGIGDLSVDAGVPFYDSNGNISETLNSARNLVALASAAFGKSSTDTVYTKDIRDRDQVRAAIRAGRGKGFTSLVTFYPPHVELINEYIRPSSDELAEAAEIVSRYEEAQSAGNPAVLLENGRTVLLLDYMRAKRQVENHSLPVPMMAEVTQ